jgi:hypothetical protein
MKDAYFYPHYIGARNDNKIQRLRLKHGMAGYGIYFCLLEVLREQSDHKYPLSDLDLLAADFRCEQSLLDEIIKKFDLFKTDKQHFWSPRLIDYLEPYYQRKEAAQRAGKASARQRNSNDRSTDVQQAFNARSTINKGSNKGSKEESFFSFLSSHGIDRKAIYRTCTDLPSRKAIIWNLLKPLGYDADEAKRYFERIHDRNYCNSDGDPYTLEMLHKEVAYYHKRGWLKGGENDTP